MHGQSAVHLFLVYFSIDKDALTHLVMLCVYVNSMMMIYTQAFDLRPLDPTGHLLGSGGFYRFQG